MTRLIHVAVGVVVGKNGNILIAKRAQQAHQGGLWEFPGGKVEAGEPVQQALVRELQEELAIHVIAAEPLIKIRHNYGDKSVLLDVYTITEFSGEPLGNEGQPICWVKPTDLQQYEFPAANRPIITAINLPKRLLITGEASSECDYLIRAEHALQLGIKFIQLRMQDSTSPTFLNVAKDLAELCNRYSAMLMLNTSPQYFLNFDALLRVGLHLNSHQLLRCEHRPVAQSILLGASCHNIKEIEQAQKVGVDYICLSPVATTTSHLESVTIGWEEFKQLTDSVTVPVFALGGMSEANLPQAIAAGAQGIAGISAWWIR